MPLPKDFTKLHTAQDAMNFRMLKMKYARSPSAAYRDSMRAEQLAIRENFEMEHMDELPAVHFLTKR